MTRFFKQEIFLIDPDLEVEMRGMSPEQLRKWARKMRRWAGELDAASRLMELNQPMQQGLTREMMERN